LNKKAYFILLFFIAFSSIEAQNTKQKVRVYLLAGQSNMDGRGDGSKLTSEDLARLQKAKEKVTLAYYTFSKKQSAPLYVTKSPDFVKKKFGIDSYFGPELFFGIEMSEKYPDDKILLIKRAIGGTSLYGCWNPDWTKEKASLMNEEKKPKLFSNFISYTKDILSQYNAIDYEICGMLWVQGEADSNVKKYGPIPAETYGINLKNLIYSVRDEFQAPNLPFAVLEVGYGNVVEGMKTVSSQMQDVTLIPCSTDPKSPNYRPTYGPPVGHYNYEGMKQIGIDFAKVFE